MPGLIGAITKDLVGAGGGKAIGGGGPIGGVGGVGGGAPKLSIPRVPGGAGGVIPDKKLSAGEDSADRSASITKKSVAGKPRGIGGAGRAAMRSFRTGRR